MKRLLALLVTCLCIFQAGTAQQTKRTVYKGLPVLVSTRDTLFIAVGDYKGNGWIVSPQLKSDSLRFASVLTLEAKFVSDLDSISYRVGPGESKQFYIKVKDKDYAHTVIYNRASKSHLKYGSRRLPDSLQFLFDKNYRSVGYYNKLKQQYPIDSCISNAKDDATRVLNLLHWVHVQWKHNGNLAPQKNDAISILEEAKEGKGFPCFAYAEVLRAALNAVGIPTRRLALKTKDVETQRSASGHVANEVYLRDLKKWIFVDPQEDIMPYLHGKPLNAVEFQQAVTRYSDKIELRSLSEINKLNYINFVYPYLYFFDSNFDHRYSEHPKKHYSGMSSMMLVPKGVKNPTRAGFYDDQKIDYCIYTHSLKDFYKAPELK
ncbi:MAG TPA: transglutaminase-like domain-containing protein [Chitinophagaceae bacterium]|nr:transglutaminase-like domain-containing protein [Chitinophagaceae bacterium]